MKTYINKFIPRFYVEYEEEIDTNYWEGKIGNSLDDFYNGKWVELSNEQVAFHQENPNATLKEVWNMQLTSTPERTIEDAKREKISEIDNYDASGNVNSFTVITENGTINAWFTPTERSNYKSSIDAAELVGIDNLQFYIGDQAMTLHRNDAKLMLAQIQLYADQCFIVTKQHESEVNALDSIEAVDNYDVTFGYPEKLNFTI